MKGIILFSVYDRGRRLKNFDLLVDFTSVYVERLVYEKLNRVWTLMVIEDEDEQTSDLVLGKLIRSDIGVYIDSTNIKRLGDFLFRELGVNVITVDESNCVLLPKSIVYSNPGLFNLDTDSFIEFGNRVILTKKGDLIPAREELLFLP